MKRKLLIGIAIAIASVSLGFTLTDYLKGNIRNVEINGVDLGTVNVKELNSYAEALITEDDMCFDNKDLDSFACTYTFESNNELSCKISYFQYLKSLFKTQSYEMDIIKFVDTAKVEAWVTSYNKSAIYPTDSYITNDDSHFYIVNDDSGTAIDYTKLYLDLSPYKYEKLYLSNYLYEPAVCEEDLRSLCNQANLYANWYCSYSNGETLQSDMSKVFIQDGRVIYDDSFIKDNIVAAVTGYNTKAGDLTNFVGHDGQTYSIPYQTWVSTVDLEAELADVKACMKELIIEPSRNPIMQTNCGLIPDSYVEVDISEQHVYVYRAGVCVNDVACVTGYAGKHDTPVGVFRVSEMINGKYLTGAGYRTYVDYWMRLNDRGIGLHDANWRSIFGGDIYLSDGSHGCINLPSDFAKELFALLEIGDCVIIHS